MLCAAACQQSLPYMIKKKNKLLRDFQKMRHDSYRIEWLKLKTIVSNGFRDAEHNYWKEQLADGIASDEMWKKSYQYIGQKSPGAPSQVISNGKMVSDPAKVADVCIDALMGKVERNVGEIQPTNKNPIDSCMTL
mgnify:FL=1